MFNIKEKEVKIGIMLLVLGGIIYFFIRIRVVLLPFLLGIVLAYLFYPLISFLKKRKIPRTWAIYFMIVFFLILIVFVSVIVVPVFINELESLTEAIPGYIHIIDKYIDYINQEYRRVNMPPIIKEAVNRTLKKAEEQVIDFAENLTEIIINSLSILFSIIIAPFITYYILRDLDGIKRGIIKCIPRNRRRSFFELGVDINNIFLGYLRSQVWISIIVAFLTGIGLAVFRVRFALLLAILAGISNMIPYIGPILGSIPAVFIAFLSSPARALSVAALLFIIQQLESSLISPRIISSEVGMHPLLVIFALLLGADLFGVWGLVISVPIAGSLIVITKFLVKILKD